MLASVTGPEEAETALAGGADIIDVLDAAPAAVAALAGRCLVSAAVGDPAAVQALAECGAAYVRIETEGTERTRQLARMAARVKLIAILFADAALDLSLLPLLAEAGFAGAMLDMRPGEPGRLLGRCDIAALRGFVAAGRSARLAVGLAGRLELPDIPRLLLLAPDFLGFRGALLDAGGRLDEARVAAVRRLIPRDPPVAPQAPIASADLVFVEDLVLPAFIGAYAHERDAPQRVRFAVALSLLPGGTAARTMDEVFSYDLITDGIRLLLDSGHFLFVETLAERIAALLLAYPRVGKVKVRVEKLDAGPARVGVEIERAAGFTSPEMHVPGTS